MSNTTQKLDEKSMILHKGKTLWLEEPETVWQVRAGTVDIFAVTGCECPRYQQVFLQAAGEGQMLFGLQPATTGDKIRLMITATQETRLVSQSRAALLGSGETAVVEDWLGVLLVGPGHVAPPRTFAFLEPGSAVSLSAGQTVKTASPLTWVRVAKGKVRHGFLPEYTLPHQEAIPLIAKAWLTATGDAELYGLSTAEVVKLASSGSGAAEMLDRAHELFREIIHAWFAQDRARDSERLAARKKQQENLLYGAAGHLLRTDMPDLVPVTTIDGPPSALLAIAKAVAVQLGIAEQQVRLPVGTDPLSQDVNQLKNIFRLAGMQTRPVHLEAGWHRQDNGPLIGYYGSRSEV